MAIRGLTGAILMIIGIGFVLSGINPQVWDSPSLRWAVLAVGFSFWLIGSLTIFITSGRGTGTYWLGSIMIVIGLLSFLAAASVSRALSQATVLLVELQRGTLFSFAVVSIIFGAFYMLMAAALPVPGTPFPQGSPQAIPPPMPVNEPRREEASEEPEGPSED